jgi:hypothetical protein
MDSNADGSLGWLLRAESDDDELQNEAVKETVKDARNEILKALGILVLFHTSQSAVDRIGCHRCSCERVPQRAARPAGHVSTIAWSRSTQTRVLLAVPSAAIAASTAATVSLH